MQKESSEKDQNLNEDHGSTILKPLETKSVKKTLNENMKYLFTSLIVVVAGIASGWLLSGRTVASQDGVGSGMSISDQKEIEVDEEDYPVIVEGVLKKNDVNGEGSHIVDTGMGEDKYAYLISTVIDLESYIGKKVKVWGQTTDARSVDFLMDVGKIKIIE